MIGAVLLRSAVQRRQSRLVSEKNLRELERSWTDDVTLTFAGNPAIEGKANVREWYRAWFDRMDRIDCTSTHVSVEKPYALGLTNTVLIEEEINERAHDGTTRRVRSAGALEFRHGKLAAVRVYVADPDGETLFSGRAAGAAG